MLAVAAFGVTVGCDNESETDTSASESSDPSATGSGPQECADIVDETECEETTEFVCAWNPDNEECEADCAAYTDEDSCNADPLCAWDSNDGCQGPI